MVRKDLPVDLKRKLQDALVNMRLKAPEVFKNMRSPNSMSAVTEDMAYVRASDAMFDGLRAMARSVKNLELLEP